MEYTKEDIAILRLIRSENIGPRTFFQLMKLFPTAQEALDMVPELAKKGGRLKSVNLYSNQQALQEIEEIEKYNAKILFYNNDNFPGLLKQLCDCPPLLIICGNDQLLKKRKIAIVGARNSSIAGNKMASLLAHGLSCNNYFVVSGLARGIDTAAHYSCVSKTIAVLANGINLTYPQENCALRNLIEKDGLIITEQPFNSIPKPQNFPARNRIISGMSLGVVVIEAAFRSGSMITANMALEQGKTVFVVPGSPLDPRNKGGHYLIKQGAILVDNAEDIINEIETNLSNNNNAIIFDSEINKYNNIKISYNENELKLARKMIIDKLGIGIISIDEIMLHTKLEIDIISVVLLELELAGRLIRYSNNKVEFVL